MSIFKSLFGLGTKSKANEAVDDLFQQQIGPVKKDDLQKKRTVLPEIVRDEISEQGTEEAQDGSESDSDNGESDSGSASSSSEDDAPVVSDLERKKKKKSGDQGDDLEAKYFQKLLGDNKEEEKEKKATEEESDSSDSDESDTEAESGKTGGKASVAKTVDTKEDELKKAERTVFVGNVSISVITSKKVYKRFKQLFTKFGKVQSIRFRSISFDEALPRKVAFKKKSLHSSRETVNAYVVYEEKESSRKAATKLNASVFEHFHIRVDHVAHPSPKDNKRSIFVGNLDFEQQEEDLWRYFNTHTDGDVESVRVVRDSKTNLGKGFAIVQFKDSLSVNKCLLLNDKPLSEESKRKLRISRAKSNAKPSILSPNHFDNLKKNRGPKGSKARLTDKQKTLIGRSSTVLGKADRSTAGRSKFVIEGERASKSKNTKIKNGKIVKKKPRIRERSTNFKNQLNKSPKGEKGDRRSDKPRRSKN